LAASAARCSVVGIVFGAEMVGAGITLGCVGVTILGCLTGVSELAAGDVSGVPALLPAGLAEVDVGTYGTSRHASRARMRAHAAHTTIVHPKHPHYTMHRLFTFDR
jgi:hypothetical protein